MLKKTVFNICNLTIFSPKKACFRYFSSQLTVKLTAVNNFFTPVSKPHPVINMPHHDGCTTRNVQGMFRSFLRNFHTLVTGVNHFLAHSFHFITQYNRQRLIDIDSKITQTDTVMNLLDRADEITSRFEFLDGGKCSGVVLPADRFFGTQRGLVNLGLGGLRRDATQTDALDQESVGRCIPPHPRGAAPASISSVPSLIK